MGIAGGMPDHLVPGTAPGDLCVGARPDVVIAVLAFRVLPGILKPRVLAAGVVHDQIQDHLHAPGMGFLHQLPEIFQSADLGVDGVVIHHIILVVGWGRVNGRKPDSRHTQIRCGFRIPIIEVIQALDNALQIPKSIAIAIGKAAHKDLVKHAVLAGIELELVRRGRSQGKGQGRDQQPDQQHGAQSFHLRLLSPAGCPRLNQAKRSARPPAP